MKAGPLFRLGLLLLVAALLFPVLSHVRRDVSDDPWEEWADRLMTGSFIVFGLAALLAVLDKLGMRVSGQRCMDCRKPIEHGKQYCRDHLKQRIDAAREKYHGQRGMGI